MPLVLCSMGNRAIRMRTRAGKKIPALLCACFLFGCKNPTPAEPHPDLELVETIALSIPDPSGLSMNAGGTALWTVSNNPDRVYELDLHGNVIRALTYTGDDLEGITYDRSDGTLWVAEETRRELVHLDTSGTVLGVQKINLNGPKNSGLEGVCVDPAGILFVVNEKKPPLFIELQSDFSIGMQYQLEFAEDLSGLAYHAARRQFWILSDQSRALFLWSPKRGLASKHSLPIPKMEGVAFDDRTNRVYVVSDSLQTLSVFQIE